MALITQFLIVNGHFTINLMAALVCFAVAWLYFDAWLGRHDKREGTKSLGFFLMTLSFVVHATAIEQTLLETSLIGAETTAYLTTFFRVAAYLVLIIGQLIDPLQPLPGYREGGGFGLVRKKASAFLILSIPFSQLVTFSYPLLAIITGFLYLRRATVGLEHHLKPIGWSMYILGISETISLAATFRQTNNIVIANIVAPFGLLWIFEHLTLIVAMFILGKWIWSYLIKRLETQLMMIFTTSTLVIFLLTTAFFTTASMRNLRGGTLSNLEINVNVLKFTIESKKAESLSDAQVIAQNSEVITAINNEDRKTLTDLTTKILLAKRQTFLVVVDSQGKILVRADDPEKGVGSLSDDSLVKRALRGEDASSIVTKDGAMAPEVSVRAATPVRNGDDLIGAVVIGSLIDNAFVDGLKDATGLDSSVYGDNLRSATTFIAPDGKSRWVGIKEETAEVKKKVLVDGEDFTGSVNILNVPYFTAYTPLKDVDGNPVGMLFVGTPQVSLLKAASETIELTFLVTAGLLIVSVFPAYFVSKFIIEQIR